MKKTDENPSLAFTFFAWFPNRSGNATHGFSSEELMMARIAALSGAGSFDQTATTRVRSGREASKSVCVYLCTLAFSGSWNRLVLNYFQLFALRVQITLAPFYFPIYTLFRAKMACKSTPFIVLSSATIRNRPRVFPNPLIVPPFLNHTLFVTNHSSNSKSGDYG